MELKNKIYKKNDTTFCIVSWKFVPKDTNVANEKIFAWKAWEHRVKQKNPLNLDNAFRFLILIGIQEHFVFHNEI